MWYNYRSHFSKARTTVTNKQGNRKTSATWTTNPVFSRKSKAMSMLTSSIKSISRPIKAKSSTLSKLSSRRMNAADQALDASGKKRDHQLRTLLLQTREAIQHRTTELAKVLLSISQSVVAVLWDRWQESQLDTKQSNPKSWEWKHKEKKTLNKRNTTIPQVRLRSQQIQPFSSKRFYRVKLWEKSSIPLQKTPMSQLVVKRGTIRTLLNDARRAHRLGSINLQVARENHWLRSKRTAKICCKNKY